MTNDYAEREPGRSDIDALQGATLLEFGNPYCGHCQRAQALIGEVLAAHEGLRHIKIFDGPGRALGRSFGIKLWPSLILMVDGAEVSRVVRPQDVAAIGQILALRDRLPAQHDRF